MSITTTMTANNLTRSELWSAQLKEQLLDTTDGMQYVDWLTEFPDGTDFTIPSIGEATVRDYSENEEVVFDSLDSGEFQMSITEYKQSGLYITKKARQDSFYSARLEAGFVPKQARALEENIVSDIFKLADVGGGIGTSGQVAGANSINGAEHRFNATGGTTQMQPEDFAKGLFALKKANVSDSGLIAIVDPSVEYTINKDAVFAGFTGANQRWDNIVEDGIGNGMKFIKNIYGFDVYVSNYLGRNANLETLTGTDPAIGDGALNLMFSTGAGPDTLPFKGAWRQTPEVDSQYNMNKQREEYVTTARYGMKLYRPENLVVCINDTTDV